jgi:hypothetical protein
MVRKLAPSNGAQEEPSGEQYELVSADAGFDST